ncbi:ribosomal-protein-alanine N-acetyltransferase [Alkalibaculum sp. M08DMB]|uniref:[Ribosomal protein bS18]-alanine N-acetyltransferase n=1 Tax=Alkalibaculum sporogenes TaxID=2655001 RepID=A0A6A7K687_9FIRM|nr:ribosomal protein S18-alanine N-acetyltransferase [Alkalibaculum sporogenes]MPW24885.1 ribosomal-protein-alanine N-acetyltransferase [Alkalibaculum sporogenes]
MIEFLSLQEKDLDRILQIENHCFKVPWSRNMFLEELDNPLADYTIIKDHGIIAGYVGMWFVLDEAHITNIAVHTDYQGKGFGGRLLSYIIDKAKIQGITSMTLEVRRSNISALYLYNRFNFVNCGIRKNYYEDTREDAIIMWRDL